MTSKAVVSRALKETVSVVGQHLDAVNRAREIYLAKIKRAEFEYFERVKLSASIIAGSGEDESSEPVIQTGPLEGATPSNG